MVTVYVVDPIQLIFKPCSGVARATNPMNSYLMCFWLHVALNANRMFHNDLRIPFRAIEPAIFSFIIYTIARRISGEPNPFDSILMAFWPFLFCCCLASAFDVRIFVSYFTSDSGGRNGRFPRQDFRTFEFCERAHTPSAAKHIAKHFLSEIETKKGNLTLLLKLHAIDLMIIIILRIECSATKRQHSEENKSKEMSIEHSFSRPATTHTQPIHSVD